MARKKRSVTPKKVTVSQMLDGIKWLALKYGINPPHLHVANPIPDEEILREGFEGTFNVYARFGGHPDISYLEKWLCEFEYGAKFRVFGSGMGAITAALFAAGEINGPIHIIAILPLYGGTYTLLRKLARSPAHHFLVTFLYADDPQFTQKLHDAVGPATRAILFEVTGNPTLTFPNIEAILHVAHNCKREIITICDNTFHFGLFKPLKWGVDVEVGSATKYLAGESAWLMGYLGVSKKFLEECPRFWSEAVEWSKELGATPGLMEAWLTKNFCVPNVMERIIQHSNNAFCVAKFLEGHPLVERVVYPGLESYPWHELALKYLEPVDGIRYFGGMISFYLKNADFARTMRFLYYLNNHTHIQHKASLGGPIDSVESPLALSHAACDPYNNSRCGITDNNVRFSVGRIASPDFTMAELDEALYATI